MYTGTCDHRHIMTIHTENHKHSLKRKNNTCKMSKAISCIPNKYHKNTCNTAIYLCERM